MGRGYKSWVVGVGVGEELIMIIHMKLIATFALCRIALRRHPVKTSAQKLGNFRQNNTIKYNIANIILIVFVLIWVDRPTRLRNTWFGFLAFVIFLLVRVCL